MKSMSEYLLEQLQGAPAAQTNEANDTIKDEKDFRAAAEAKFKEVFKDDLDEKKMNDTIDGILADNKELVDAGKWGELIGILNKSFAN